MMEIGNLIFGHSRGTFPVERETVKETAIRFLFFHLDGTCFEEFENGIFRIFPYSHGECDCGSNLEDHEAECKSLIPNFLFKPTGYALNWYKQPLRDSYSNQSVSDEEFYAMIMKCLESLELEWKTTLEKWKEEVYARS